jgi:predicted secreted protein
MEKWMIRRTLAITAAIALVAASCGDDTNVRIDPDDPVVAVTIERHQTLEIGIEGNPTTGFEWTVAEEGIVRLIDRTHTPYDDTDGSPGITTLIFEPTGTGTADLVLIYHRPWDQDAEPHRTRTIAVTVTG